MKWDEFYDRYLDLETEDAIMLSKEVEGFKNPDEVFDVVCDFASVDKEYACEFLKKAFCHGITFEPDDIYEMMDMVDQEFFVELILNASKPYSLESLIDLFEYADDYVVQKIIEKDDLDIYANPDLLYEMVISIIADNKARAQKYLKEANRRNVRFTSEQITEFSGWIDSLLLYDLAINASTPYTDEELETLSVDLPLFLFQSLTKRLNIDESRFIDEDEEVIEVIYYEEPIRPKKHSLLFNLIGGMFIGALRASEPKKKHSGKCEGDCDTCPPHWGYRYGRRYYGRLHSSGCDFGGRKNAG